MLYRRLWLTEVVLRSGDDRRFRVCRRTPRLDLVHLFYEATTDRRQPDPFFCLFLSAKLKICWQVGKNWAKGRVGSVCLSSNRVSPAPEPQPLNGAAVPQKRTCFNPEFTQTQHAYWPFFPPPAHHPGMPEGIFPHLDKMGMTKHCRG